jgi:hypothetical protein
MKLVGISLAGGAALTALALMLSPATAASTQAAPKKARPSLTLNGGNFTPAVADPRLAAELARRGVQSSAFRFTPAISAGKDKAVRVAVRVRAATPAQAARDIGEGSGSAVTAITPTAYNLGVSVGWRNFAVSGDVASVRGGALPGGRDAAEVGVSYILDKFTGRVDLGAGRGEGTQPRLIPNDETYSLGLGGSYRIGRNIDLTGGVRYKIQRDRLEPIADDRRDSQAIYIGTAFRF